MAEGPNGADIMYLTSNDGSGTPSTAKGVPELYGESIIPNTRNGPLLIPLSSSEVHHLGVSIPPPKKPPRA